MELVTDQDLEEKKVPTQIETPVLSDEPAATPEVSQEEEKPVETTPYTDEEFETLHLNDLDETRLTPTQRKYAQKMKDLEKGYNKKYQDLAQERKQYESSRQTITTPPAQYGDIYQAYDADPKGVMQNLRTILAQKRREDPSSEEVIRLENLRDDLMERKLERTEQFQQVAMVASTVNNEVRKVIPDFDTKAEALTDFAVNELGLDLQEVKYLTDPRVMGPMAGKITLAVNKLFDLAHPKKAKPVTKIPKTERAGGGFEQPKEKTHSRSDYFAERSKNRA